ncbi:ring-cleaving dioxygenase [Limimaricola hongkongensis]|uniref:Glyoxalase family protein n=1 Tax=Limimaricola hongkongensis DSM 17492 TaxID=1122180 RepID=A0A017HFN5_9RHOB|nr:ring-cleaving dioxygenase [Limimaricola hongkongensis]EYD72968.1 Glyoxalase family protein [Limimaricola hongkongensis DSM 17492]
MLTQIRGLHHVTAMASGARANNAFYTDTLGLRRVKKTVNFDAPDVYHLYYGDQIGTPGTVMTYFPFPDAARGRRGAGEVSLTSFSVPEGSLDAWQARLDARGVQNLSRDTAFGAARLLVDGPDGERLALVETPGDDRAPWTGGGVAADIAIRGFRGVEMLLRDKAATVELLTFMGYRETAAEGAVTRYAVAGGNPADAVDIRLDPAAHRAASGAGSVHHIAFAVENRDAQAEVAQRLAESGWQTTPQIDRDYFFAIYFRSPGGVLFEIATNEPGFDRDEDRAHLGEALKLPRQHEHLREKLERSLEPLDGA